MRGKQHSPSEELHTSSFALLLALPRQKRFDAPIAIKSVRPAMSEIDIPEILYTTALVKLARHISILSFPSPKMCATRLLLHIYVRTYLHLHRRHGPLSHDFKILVVPARHLDPFELHELLFPRVEDLRKLVVPLEVAPVLGGTEVFGVVVGRWTTIALIVCDAS